MAKAHVEGVLNLFAANCDFFKSNPSLYFFCCTIANIFFLFLNNYQLDLKDKGDAQCWQYPWQRIMLILWWEILINRMEIRGELKSSRVWGFSIEEQEFRNICQDSCSQKPSIFYSSLMMPRMLKRAINKLSTSRYKASVAETCSSVP